MMHPGFIWAEVAVLAIVGVIPPAGAFLLHVERIGLRQPACRPDYDSKYHIHVPVSTGQCCPLASAVRTSRPSISVKMSSADGSIQHQSTSSLEAPKGLEDADTRSMNQSNPSLTPVAPLDRVSTRIGMALDGTPLQFRRPTTEEMHKLGMGKWVAQKGLALALIAIHEEDVGVCAPLAGAVVESVDGAGGSSVATRVYMLRHWDLDGVSASVQHALLDEAIAQFLNDGARIGQLRVEVDGSHKSLDFYSRHGFVRSSTNGTPSPEGNVAVLSGDRKAGLRAIRALPREGASIGAVGMNLMGRLLHDVGDLQGAVNAYLKALEMNPSRSEVFRGLGGAYQSQRQHQMAFASYQQAINLAPNDLLTYLKLGMLYEELAVGKYEEAGDHAIRCFDYYLQHSGSDDTDVLTRLGNLQVFDDQSKQSTVGDRLFRAVFPPGEPRPFSYDCSMLSQQRGFLCAMAFFRKVRRLDPSSAIKTYERALAVDPSLANVWFNLANAYLQLGQEQEASRCLHEKLRLDPDGGVTTKYLLASLESQPERLSEVDQTAYARELFDYYASTYDDHMRKRLLYTGPRLLRKNVKDVYNETFGSLPEEVRSGHNNDVLSYLNGSLDILDLGCGTGLIGSWFKDYARTLVGVDVSPMMLDMATKKGCYHELRRGDIRKYLAASAEEVFDLIVAAETLQYIGPLGGVFGGAFRVLRVGGYFAFTVDRLIEDAEEDDDSRETTEGESERGASRRCQTSGSSGRLSLKTDGTYAYNRAYLEALALKNNFDIIVLKHHSSLIQRGVAAPGYMGILRKGTSKNRVRK